MICTSLEPAGVEHILGHSTETHTLRYTELDGRGDGTSHQQVKDVHSHAGIEVTKHGCIGHVQKGMGTVLKKLKEETPGQIKGKLTDAMKKKNVKLLRHCIMEQCGKLGGNEERGFSKHISLYLQSATPFPDTSTGEFKNHTF